MIDKTVENNAKTINLIKFKKLERFKCGEALASLFVKNCYSDITLKTLLRNFISTMFLQNLKIDVKGDGKVCLICTTSCTARADYVSDVKKVMSCIKKPTLLVGEKKLCFKLSRILALPLVCVWYAQMHKLKYPKKFKVYMCINLLRSYITMNEVDRLLTKNFKNISLCVSFCDIWVESYLYTCLLKEKGVLTGTLQHAVFSHYSQGWAYLYSKSEYFLAISDWAKREAELSGYTSGKLEIVGPMKYINEKLEVCNNKSLRKVVGIALSSPMYEADNRYLLQYGMYIKQKYMCEVIVRCHPAIDIEKYADFVDLSEIRVLQKNTSMQQFAIECDFIIMGITNVFADLITIGSVAYRFIKFGDIYDEVNDFYFNNEQELSALIDELYSNREAVDRKVEEIRSYFCPTHDIASSYKQFFARFE